MKLSRRTSGTVAQQAAEWTEILKRAGNEERAAFDAWLMESPSHVREFLLLSAVDRALDSVDCAGRHDVTALLAQARQEPVALRPISQSASAKDPVRRERTSWRWLAAASIALLVLGAAGWQWQQRSDWQEFSTATGEQRTLKLSDGSVVALNTQSRLQVRYSAAVRDLRLLQGQALFRVSADAARPFRVAAGETSIQALGTAFDVYRRGNADVRVAVIEGRVQVSRGGVEALPLIPAPVLTAGEEMSVAANGDVIDRSRLDEASATAWRQRRLVFRRDTLATVVEEFNRYNQELQFKVEDSQIAAHRYSGEFDADDPESLLQLLAADEKLNVRKTHGVVAISGKDETPDSARSP